MRLNPDCVRALLLVLEEELQFDEALTYPHISFAHITKNPMLKDYPAADIAYTTLKLMEAGFINAATIPGDDTFDALYASITYEGHQFLESVRKEENWKKTKEVCGKIGSFTLKSIKSVAEGVATAAIKNYFGL